MSQEVIQVHGEDVIVREDTAKEFRGVRWALISIFVFAAIAALLVVLFVLAPNNAWERSPANSPSAVQTSNVH